MSTIVKQVQELHKKQDQAIELTLALQERIEELLNPPKPDFLTIKQCCVVLDRTHSIVLKYIKELDIQPHTIGRSKTYHYKDIERLGVMLGITLKNIA